MPSHQPFVFLLLPQWFFCSGCLVGPDAGRFEREVSIARARFCEDGFCEVYGGEFDR